MSIMVAGIDKGKMVIREKSQFVEIANVFYMLFITCLFIYLFITNVCLLDPGKSTLALLYLLN